MSIDKAKIESIVRSVARQHGQRTSGYAQEKIVITEIRRQLGEEIGGRLDNDVQRHVLDCWQSLFRNGELAWGVDLDNPNHPFFHVVE